MNFSKNTRLIIALIAIIIMMAAVSVLWGLLWNIISDSSLISFETDNKIYLTGNDKDLQNTWNLFENKAGLKDVPGNFSAFSLKRMPDGIIESFIVTFYSKNNGEWYTYQVSYHDEPKKDAGEISATIYKTNPVNMNIAEKYTLSPGLFLKNIDSINLTGLGYENDRLSIESDNSQGDLEYSHENEKLFLQDGNIVMPVKKLVLEIDDKPVFPVSIFRMNCSEIQGGGTYCSSTDYRTVFFKNQLDDDADISLYSNTSHA
jgi:hypothetical protein